MNEYIICQNITRAGKLFVLEFVDHYLKLNKIERNQLTDKEELKKAVKLIYVNSKKNKKVSDLGIEFRTNAIAKLIREDELFNSVSFINKFTTNKQLKVKSTYLIEIINGI